MSADIGSTFGSILVSLVASAALYGVTLMQTYKYYRRYPNDTMALKLMVAGLTVLDTLHLILCTRTIYWYLVSNFNNTPNLDVTTWSMALQTDCNGLIGVLVEFFFARRVWMMSQKNWFVTTLIVILSLIHFTLGIVFTVESFELGHFSRFTSLTWITCTGLGSAAAADILIAVTMCYYLMQKKTGIESTDSIVTTLMLYSINTGLLTSVIATLAVIMFATMPVNFVWLSFFWILGKCYTNSFLAALNSRDNLRQKASAVRLSNRNGNPRVSTLQIRSESSMKPSAAGLAVNVETHTEYRADYPDSPARTAFHSPSQKDWSPISSLQSPV